MKVLYIEDDESYHQVLEFLLQGRRTFTEIRYTKNLMDGLRSYSTYPPDIILLDLNLPDSSGIDTLQAMPKTVPIVVLTGISEPSFIQSCIKAGASEVLIKGNKSSMNIMDALISAKKSWDSDMELKRNISIVIRAFEELTIKASLLT